MLKTFRESLCAGILITIGGTVFLSCENKTAGAVLFSVALLCICYKGYYLFTGKIGYIVEQHKKQDFLNLAVGLFGNLIATFLLGMLLQTVLPNIGERAAEMCSAKLAQFPLYSFIRGFFCTLPSAFIRRKIPFWAFSFACRCLFCAALNIRLPTCFISEHPEYLTQK